MGTAVHHHDNQPWYAFWGNRYTGNQPPFYDKTKLPWVKTLEDNWEIMRDELLDLLEAEPDRLQPYYINKTMSFPPKHWKTLGLIFWNLIIEENCKKCPNTVRLLKEIGGVTSFSISVLEPGSNINPHQGDTDAIIRCHVGLVIPGTLPDLGFQVGNEIRAWEPGKALPFCDAITHTAWNHTKKRRIIINMDVMRPEFVKRQNRVCAHVLASCYLQMLYPRFPILSEASGYFRNTVYHLVRLYILLYLPIQKWLRS